MASEAARGADVIVSSRSEVIFTANDAHEEKNKVTAKNVARPSRNQKSEYLAQWRKGRKEIRLPDLPFLASWRDAELLSRLALQRG